MMPIQNGQMVHQMIGLIAKSEKNNPWVDNPGIFISIQLRKLSILYFIQIHYMYIYQVYVQLF